jgi:RNA polymerase sigma-70 factor (ECF subfamily)
LLKEINLFEICSLLSEPIEHIIKGCKSGKHEAYEELYKLFAARMWAVCLRYARDYDNARDILQDSFIKVYEKINQFEGRGSIEGWIRRIVVNTALGEYRKQHHLSIDAVNNSEDDEKNYENFECNLEAEELLILIKELPPQYRMVFNLYAIEGYSHKEIGDMLSISEGTSKSNLSRARSILQKKLEMFETNSMKIG